MCVKPNFIESITIEPILDNINEPINLFDLFLKHFAILDKDRLSWSLTLTEVLANAIRHGSNYKMGDVIDISWKYSPNEISITIIDQGTGPSNPLIESPSLPDDLVAESGRGLFIVNSFIDVWLHRKSIEGYKQTLIKFTQG